MQFVKEKVEEREEKEKSRKEPKNERIYPVRTRPNSSKEGEGEER